MLAPPQSQFESEEPLLHAATNCDLINDGLQALLFDCFAWFFFMHDSNKCKLILTEEGGLTEKTDSFVMSKHESFRLISYLKSLSYWSTDDF